MKTTQIKEACIVNAMCTAPLSNVWVSDRLYGDSIDARVCGVHVLEIPRLGFQLTPKDPWVNVTALVSEDAKRLAHASILVKPDRWEEIGSAPRSWCPRACKLYARRFGNAVSFQLLHNRTYGCRLGT
jgi:hypothetical protein